MRNKKAKIAVIILSGIVAVVLFLLYWRVPNYLAKKEILEENTSFETSQVKVMSYNIKCKLLWDMGEQTWYSRAHLIVEGIKEAAPGVIGFQEMTPEQYDYLCDILTGYGAIVEYRDDGIFPEGCALFYNEKQFELVKSECFWLSETPDVMSKSWGAEFNRICSCVLLKEKASGKEFMVFNTHLDSKSEESRIKGIQVVLDKIAKYGDVPAILMGDLNAEEDSETYKSAMESFLDSKYETENTMTSCTYQGWGEKLDRDCIDYILISKTGFTVNSYKVIRDTFEGRYASDHFPLMAELELE